MKNFLVLSSVVFALGCAGGKSAQRSSGGGGGDETPQWVKQGTGAFSVEAGKKLQGVGVVSGTHDPKTRRQQADAKALEQLAGEVDILAQSLSKLSENTKDNAGEDIKDIAKRAAQQAAEIRDHWVTPDGAESALVVVDLGAFKQALQGVSGDDKLKKEMSNNADRSFDSLSK